MTFTPACREAAQRLTQDIDEVAPEEKQGDLLKEEPKGKVVEKSKEQKGRILLVDDEEVIRDSLGELLTACGFFVYKADSVDNAATVLERQADILRQVSDTATKLAATADAARERR